MNEAWTTLMGSGYFYQMGEQIGESLAKAIKEALVDYLKPSAPAELQSFAPTILPEVGKRYEFDTPDDAIQVVGIVTAVEYPWVKLRDYGGVINLEQIAYYYCKDMSAPKDQP